MRLTELISSNGHGLSEFQYRQIKKRFPLVVEWSDGAPHFRDQPENAREAANWIRNYRLVQRYEEEHDINAPRKLVLTDLEEEPGDIEQYLIDKFNLSPQDYAT